MRGQDLVDQLKRKFECASDRQLAEAIGYTNVGVGNIRDQSSVTERGIAELVSKAQACAVERAAVFKPIVEFFPLDEGGDFLSKGAQDQVRLRKLLSKACGIYSFYNSELEIIYVGKTVERNLYDEAKNAYGREMLHYERYRVNHPHGKFAIPNGGKVRKIVREQIHLFDAAEYFSAYSIHPEFVSAVETLLVRLLPNDLLNVRMEGNTSLEAYSGEE